MGYFSRFQKTGNPNHGSDGKFSSGSNGSSHFSAEEARGLTGDQKTGEMNRLRGLSDKAGERYVDGKIDKDTFHQHSDQVTSELKDFIIKSKPK